MAVPTEVSHGLAVIFSPSVTGSLAGLFRAGVDAVRQHPAVMAAGIGAGAGCALLMWRSSMARHHARAPKPAEKPQDKTDGLQTLAATEPRPASEAAAPSARLLPT